MASRLSKIYFLICKKFGFTDDTAAVNNLDETHGRVQPQSSPRYGCDNDCSAAASSSAEAGSPSFRDNTPEHTQAPAFDALVREIQERRQDHSQLEKYFETVNNYYQQNFTGVLKDLQEEQYRCEQDRDLTELYQNEILNVIEELASTEDKISYQSHKKATDIHEALVACHTRLFNLEQQQQVELEDLDNVTAWTFFGKQINMLLAVMATLLVWVSICVVTLMRTRSCTLSTLLFVLVACLWRHWDAMLDSLHYFVCTKCPEKGDDQ